MRSVLLIAFALVVPSGLFGQQFNEADFLKRLNEALERDGVTVHSYEDPGWTFSDPNLIENKLSVQVDLPEYGIAAYEGEELKTVFGPSVSTIMDENGEIVGVAGYTAGPSTRFSVIGADEYAAKIQEVRSVSGLDEGLQRAITSMKSATNYIMAELCSTDGRPSQITLNLSADFKLVFGASTGTSATWVMSETCNNFQR
ncbi:MAG TPA: hypothetical protein DIU10_03615 [Sulfitobacter sp.]|jgi:hypothetical protein|uniref:hypothetical protein n=1 Tax=Sulfitobacter sp. TaxID=1903071 RepID=UPI000C4651A0|nr:hypothetical protein [Sulfitobacter sp.]MBD83144.1 hypothetical protein [Sulfitobacter sp.]HCQ56975.1 hypothetical protein [Sulfitobacter sp.]|tara:strand:- start:51 stop:650 length:600 start_codon:yes stop_codon:yes gene_type:complete